MSRILPVSVWKFAFAVIASVGAGSWTTMTAAPTWLRVETPEFVVFSDAATRDISDFAVQYSAYHRAFHELFGASGHTLPPSTVVLFRRSADFVKHTPAPQNRRTTLVNYSVDVDGSALLALALSSDLDEALARTFEFETVWRLHRMGYFLPIWATQGAGEVLATIHVSKGKCLVGRESGQFVEQFAANRELIPWAHFFEIGESSPEYAGKLATGAFHSQAWALMHWILFKDEQTSARFQSLADNLKTMAPVDAIHAVTGQTADHFRPEIEKHLKDFRGARAVAFDEKSVRATFKFTPAAEADVLVETSNLLAAAGRLDESNAQLGRARQLAPERAEVKEAWARRALRENHPDEATRLYREAIAAGSKNITAYLNSATARLNAGRPGHADDEGSGNADTLIALEEVRRAIELNPGSSDAYQLLGRSFWILPQVSEKFVAELSRGVTAGEAGARVRFYRALLYKRLGKTEECLSDLRQVIADREVTDPDRERAKERLGNEQYNFDLKKVNRLVAQSQHDAARAIIKLGTAQAINATATERYTALLAWVDEDAAWSNISALADAHRWTDLRRAAQAFANDYPKSRRATSAQRLAAEAERMEKASAK